MKLSISIFSLFLTLSVQSQLPIGSRTITYNDPSRMGGNGQPRPIECAVYYPGESAGANAPVAVGTFPIVVFGHGFAMQWTAYQNIWEFFTPKGYILIFPKTESGISPAPSHNDFALDLAFVSNKLLEENSNANSPFYGKINGRSAIMGHSMGGGATMLAAKNNFNIKTIVGLAPAETTPSAIAATSDVVVPALILSGSSDGVTPPAEHHQPIFNGLSSLCKSFVSITGGAHCYFANSNLACDFGESTASTGITVSRGQQQTFMNAVVLPWLNFYLLGDCDGYTQFQSAINQTGLVSNHTCNYQPITYTVTTNNTSSGQSTGSAFVTWSGGSFPVDFTWFNGSTNPELNNLAVGSYSFTITDNFCTLNGVADIGDGTAGIESGSQGENIAFPNPTNGLVMLEFSGSQQRVVALCDFAGKTLKEFTSDFSHTATIDLSNYESGIYILMTERISGEKKAILVVKD